ncbi:type IV secretory system conjugative DNA transfer family protein [Thalassobius sp. Cn5-15]|uniref:type IV secretory system conjugative DNA transfer family protein n=1 Tax=Thalassobius sp. Cn5-15 TaxID=2917763 RepID=UPI001EF37143|nr:type IV secretory system conjugative DNA transfer family protein [Thalassobius sp. Cn5-15]MCG7492498.1 type IV secretory system conjugative DNA transfer family protein [Thalassobius sp. Cn5-15]
MDELIYYFGMTIVRIVMVVASFGIGFLLGWLFSPKSASFRKMALYIIVGVLVFATIFLNNLLGWNAAVLLAIIAFVFGLAYWLGGLASGFFDKPTTFGSSRWATHEDVASKDAFGTDGIRIGKFKNAEGEMDWVSYKGDRHLLTVAPTRAGKGTTQIIPNLLTYGGSALVIDPKGENAFATAERRQQMGQEIQIVDPWAITPLDDLQVSSFNPLDWLDTTDPDLPENAMLLASALVVEGNSKDPFWDEEAKALLQGLTPRSNYACCDRPRRRWRTPFATRA